MQEVSRSKSIKRNKIHQTTPELSFYHLLWLTLTKAKKVVLFPEIGRMKFFYLSPALIIEFLLMYIILISKSKQKSKKKTKKQKQKQNKNTKKVKQTT